MKRIVIVLLALVALGPSRSVAQEILWSNRYGDSIGGDAPSIARDRDGSFIVLGRTRHRVPPPSTASFYMRIRSDGRRVYDTLAALPATARERWVFPAPDRAFHLVGTPFIGGGLEVARLRSDGSQFYRGLIGEARDQFLAGGAHATRDTGFIVAGTFREKATDTTVSINVMKFGSSGVRQWHRTYPIARLISVHGVRQHSSGAYFVLGSASRDSALVVAKLDWEGNLLWGKMIAGELPVFGSDLVELADGSMLAATSVLGANATALYRLASSDGSLLSESVYEGIGRASTIERSDGGGVLLLTWNDGSHLHRIGDDGALVWSKDLSDVVDWSVSSILPFRGYVAIVGSTNYEGIDVTILRESGTSGVEIIEGLPAELDLW